MALVDNQVVQKDSTTATLAGAGTYTGTGFSPAGYGRIVASVFADQAGTLFVEQAANGTNYDISDSFAVTASTGQKIDVAVCVGGPSSLVRFRYVNGATLQGAFRMYGGLRRTS